MNKKTLPILVFDMDGVILNSLESLSKCLVTSISKFCQSKEDYERFIEYDLANPGISRFEKVDFFLGSFEIKSNMNLDLVRQAILQDFDNNSLRVRLESEVESDIFQINKFAPKENCVLLSNCDNVQLKIIAAHFGFFHLFGRGLFGTPPNKESRMSEIIRNSDVSRVISISDSETDAIIARVQKVDFVFISRFARDDGSWMKDGELGFETIGKFYQYLENN